MKRSDKEMRQVRENVLELIKAAKTTHVLSFSANDVAKEVGCSVSTATDILREFGLVTDGYRWFFPTVQ